MSNSHYGRSQLSSSSYISNRRYHDSPKRQNLTSSAPSSYYEKKSAPVSSKDELLSIYQGLLIINANENTREELRKSVEDCIESWKNIESIEEQLEQKRQKKNSILDKISESEVKIVKKYWEYIQADRKDRLVEGDLLFTENLINELQNEDGTWPDTNWELPMFTDYLEGETNYIGTQDEYEVEMSEPQDNDDKEEEYEIS